MKTKLTSIFLMSGLLLHVSYLKTEPTMNNVNAESGQIKLFVQTGCYYCDKVINYLKKIGKLDQVTILNINDPKNFTELKKLSGGVQRPFLSDEPRHVCMLESDDIIKYFSTRFN